MLDVHLSGRKADVEQFRDLLVRQSLVVAQERRQPILLGQPVQLLAKDRPPTREQFLNDALATMACRAAVKAGDRLTAEEIASLLEQRELAENTHHCPHGRPTSLLFSRKELDRQFRRI